MTKTSDSSTSENKNAKDFPAFFGCYRMPAPHDERAASHLTTVVDQSPVISRRRSPDLPR